MDRLGPLDAAFVIVEDSATHTHIGSCAIFVGPAFAVVDLIESKLVRLPRSRRRLRFVPVGLTHLVRSTTRASTGVRRSSHSPAVARGRGGAGELDRQIDVAGARP